MYSGADAALVKRAEEAEDKYNKLKASINFSQMEKRMRAYLTCVRCVYLS
jgi:hypothetical protein